MKYLAILAASALAACASHNNPPAANPPAASSDTVEQASNTPSAGPSFAPAENDGTAAAKSDARTAPPHGSPTDSPATPGQTAQDTRQRDDNGDSSMHGNGAANAAAMPSQSPTPSEPDNSRVNARDKGGNTLTPMDQGKGEGDRKITQNIRQAVVKDSSLSFTAKNVKIITINGKVTLRGPVKTDAERSAIEAAAKKVAGVNRVDNFLEVKN
jgi:hyperosmotically inducible protein